MEKNQLLRNEALAQAETHIKRLDQQRAELSKELEEVEQRRNDLRETIEILGRQVQGLQQVLEFANSPKAPQKDTIDAGVEYSGRTITNRATKAADWFKGE
jgi:chromosome segregation ATPase